MKIERFFSKLLLVAVLCTFCACSSDDDEDLNTGGSGQGSISLNIGGTNINLNNVYWASEANDDNTTYYELQFMSFDMLRIPGRWRLFIIPVKLFSRLFIFRCPRFTF